MNHRHPNHRKGVERCFLGERFLLLPITIRFEPATHRLGSFISSSSLLQNGEKTAEQGRNRFKLVTVFQPLEFKEWFSFSFGRHRPTNFYDPFSFLSTTLARCTSLWEVWKQFLWAVAVEPFPFLSNLSRQLQFYIEKKIYQEKKGWLNLCRTTRLFFQRTFHSSHTSRLRQVGKYLTHEEERNKTNLPKTRECEKCYDN